MERFEVTGFGFIGFGSMAKMLIRCLIEYAGVDPGDIYVTRKDKSRLAEIGDVFGANAVNTPRDVVASAQVVFLCMKPAELKDILSEIVPFVKKETHLISIVGTASTKVLGSVVKGKITWFTPAITSEIGAGVSLICHNEHVTEEDAAVIEGIISKFSKIKHVRDEDCGFVTELTSCMPGFIASIFDNITNAALEHTGSFSKEEIEELIIDTLFATAKLLSETGMSFEEVVSRVATNGGITQEGVDVLNDALPEVFDEMYERTLKKRRGSEEKMAEALTKPYR